MCVIMYCGHRFSQGAQKRSRSVLLLRLVGFDEPIFIINPGYIHITRINMGQWVWQSADCQCLPFTSACHIWCFRHTLSCHDRLRRSKVNISKKAWWSFNGDFALRDSESVRSLMTELTRIGCKYVANISWVCSICIDDCPSCNLRGHLGLGIHILHHHEWTCRPPNEHTVP